MKILTLLLVRNAFYVESVSIGRIEVSPLASDLGDGLDSVYEGSDSRKERSGSGNKLHADYSANRNLE